MPPISSVMWDRQKNLHRFACSHCTHLPLWLKDFRNHMEILLRKQVATQSDSSFLPHPCSQLLNPISLPFLCPRTSVEPAEVTLLGTLTAVEGQDLHLTCSASSSNPPVQIRWWLGHKELNASAIAMEEVRCCKQRGEKVETRTWGPVIPETGPQLSSRCLA